ncbi:YiiX/YebB-like N1pC/P60 family cysteine hydrolase [Aquisphaera insulae]|uniref:YiiX/YebB-like N1pC/P60 family cysteine hydrolase n=1 Tax=Aquisphaera insulae TaxID=2712864 RepID=UPI0013EC1BF1|nr:YiiX/YebB-like N1pC/P60 family cysteine hydrolase [Aquisphaera insulae]
MLSLLLWFMPILLESPSEGEATDRLVPAGFRGNYWGPEACKARKEGKLSALKITPEMARWDDWGRKVLKDGDIVFRMGDARVLRGLFPMSKFYANCSNSKFSHTGIVELEDGQPFVYDTTGTGPARQPLSIWLLDNVGCLGVKRLKEGLRQEKVPKILAYLHRTFKEQPPFDYELGLDDSALYCVEMTEKAYRYAGVRLSEPVKIGDMERATEFPVCMLGIGICTKFALEHPLTAETPVYFPGNERHGIWSSPDLVVVVPPTFRPAVPDAADSSRPLVADFGNTRK